MKTTHKLALYLAIAIGATIGGFGGKNVYADSPKAQLKCCPAPQCPPDCRPPSGQIVYPF